MAVATPTETIAPHGGTLVNRLAGPAFGLAPAVQRVYTRLASLDPAGCLMSGSGSAVFGLFSRRPAAERAARALSKSTTAMIGPGEKGLQRILVTRTINRTAYQRLAGIPAHHINLLFAS